MVFDHLINAFSQINNLITSPDSKIEENLIDLATYIHTNGQAIRDDLIKHKDHLSLLQRIGQIELKDSQAAKDVHNVCALLELKVLLQGDNPEKLAEWVLKNKAGVSSKNPSELFYDLSKAREQLIEAKLLVPEVGNTLSELVTSGLGLKGQKDAAKVIATILSILNQNSLEALAHWINAEKIYLDKVNLQKSELETIAPYLHYITHLCDSDFNDVTYGNAEKFLNSCSNAYQIFITSDEITKLKPSSSELQILCCSYSKNLASLDLSNCKNLQKLICNHCSLSTLDLSNNKELQELECTNSKKLTTVNLSKNNKLQKLDCTYSPISSLDLSNCPQLKELECIGSKILTLDLSQNLYLQKVSCNNCQNLTTLDFSNNLYLKELLCNRCTNLTSLGPSLSNVLENLSCCDCINLSQLPQVPATASVYTCGSLCGDLASFRVNPLSLEENPKQVLLNLGKILLQNKPMPNIVYLNSPGLDAGGLRRQLVATLCENLFKPDSNFAFVKEDGYDIPTSNNVDALRTFARLLGLAAVSGVPTGTNLHPSFFHALFTLNDQELENISYNQLIPEPPRKKLHMSFEGLPEESFREEDANEMGEKLERLNAAAIIAKELRTLLGLKFRQFERRIEEFIVRVQGSRVTKENLKQNIHCKDDQYQEWINSFIDRLPNDKLKDFVMLLTGSYTLSEGKITFKVYPERKHLESSTIIHTCSKKMELAGDFTRDLLHQELKEQLSLLKSFNAV